jgi:large subunit ribosomal protein L1
MAKRGKKYSKAAERVVSKEMMPLNKALGLIKDLSYAKFDESVDVDINLGIDAGKGEQAVRGSVILPHGRGRKARVIVFAKGDHAIEAEKAGADFVGAQDLVDKIRQGWMEFDYSVATPDMMGVVGSLAKILGPRGLLPNKKLGTVTVDVGSVVEDLKRGRAFFKNDKSGLVHFTVGKVSFDADKLRDNVAAFVKALVAAKPATAKGKYLKKMTITSTMGVGIPVDTEELSRSS